MRDEIDWTNPMNDCHLRKRCQQRGVPKRDFQTLMETADRLVPVGGGRVSATLSRSAVVAMRAEGTACTSLDRAARRAVVFDADGTPITVLIPSGRYRRHYWRGLTGRRWIRSRGGR
jgi:hypothetical protein